VVNIANYVQPIFLIAPIVQKMDQNAINAILHKVFNSIFRMESAKIVKAIRFISLLVLELAFY